LINSEKLYYCMGLKEVRIIYVRMDNTIDVTEVDSVVKNVINKFLQRSHVGKLKYGTDLDRNDLSPYDWITHAQEELMDAIFLWYW